MTLFLGAYVAVLTMELVGDKLIYSTAALAARYSVKAILTGLFVAFAAKMGAAVLLGRVLTHLPSPLIVGMSVVTFLLTAAAIWHGERQTGRVRAPAEEGLARNGVVVAFAMSFFTEWGDPGQLTAAALAARFDSPAVVWLAAVAALSTKAVLALTLGVTLRRVVPKRVLRLGAIGVCVILGVISLVRVEAQPAPAHGATLTNRPAPDTGIRR